MHEKIESKLVKRHSIYNDIHAKVIIVVAVGIQPTPTHAFRPTDSNHLYFQLKDSDCSLS